MAINTGFLYFVIVFVLLAKAHAHLAFAEPERLRNDNFDADSGYAKPAPNGAEDYSFESPFDIFTQLAVPASGAPGSQPTRRDDNSFTISTTLSGWDDYDVFRFNKTGNSSLYTFLLYASVPACRENLDFYPSVALLGPLDAVDADSGQRIFRDPATMSPRELADLPFDIPAGLGVLVKHFRRAGRNERRPGYFSSRGPNWYMYAQGWRADCLEAPFPADCNFNDFAIYRRVRTPGMYYGVIFRESRAFSSPIQDVEFIGGIGENFVPSDFTRLAVLGQSTAYGRSIHGRCREVPPNKIDLYIPDH